jgi:hypothetical protein
MENQIQKKITPTFIQQHQSSSYSTITIKILFNDSVYNWNVNFMDLNFNYAIVRYFFFP